MEHDLSVKGVWMIKVRPPCLECSLLQPERSHGRANSLQAAQLRKRNPNAFPFLFPFRYTRCCTSPNTCILASGKNTP